VANKILEPPWQIGDTEFSARRGRRSRGNSRLLAPALVLVGVAAGMLLSHFLTSDSSLGMACALVLLAGVLPFLAARLLKERLGAGSERPFRRQISLECPGDEAGVPDDLPAGLLIVSSDLRIRFANRAFLAATFQNLEDVLGWRLEDVIPAEGLEEQARSLLNRPGAATSCCFTSLPGRVPTERRPVSITMTRLLPEDGEERILVVIEDLLQSFPACQAPLVEGYIC
jgi:PAS domain-containing protein